MWKTLFSNSSDFSSSYIISNIVWSLGCYLIGFDWIKRWDFWNFSSKNFCMAELAVLLNSAYLYCLSNWSMNSSNSCYNFSYAIAAPSSSRTISSLSRLSKRTLSEQALIISYNAILSLLCLLFFYWSIDRKVESSIFDFDFPG